MPDTSIMSSSRPTVKNSLVCTLWEITQSSEEALYYIYFLNFSSHVLSVNKLSQRDFFPNKNFLLVCLN